jgi:hypothetical protein
MVDVTAHNGIVGKKSVVVVWDNVLMGCTAGIVSRENGIEGCDTIRVRSLKSTEICASEGSLVAGNVNAGVDSSCIGSPNIQHHVFDSLASRVVNELELEMDWNSGLRLRDVGADELAMNIVRANGHLGSEDTGSAPIGGK